MKLSTRSKKIPTSAVRELSAYEKLAINNGIEILHLNIGAPDLAVSPVFFDVIKNLDSNELGYAPSPGIPALLDEVKQYYLKMGANYQTNEIFVTNGGSEGILFALLAMCDVNDSILVPEPFYSNYKAIASLAQIQIDPIITNVNNGFHLPEKNDIIQCIKSSTKAILLSNPANPTGVVYTKEEIMMICEIAIQNNLWIIADEVYREFIYDGFETISFSIIPEISNRVVIVDSISKRFSACGARIGLLLSKNKEVNEILLKMCQSRLSISTIDQLGATALYSSDMDYIKRSIPEYKKRRDLICELLGKIDGVTLRKPEGAFYIMVGLPVENASDFSKWLLTEFEIDGQTVMLTPGHGFYKTSGLGLNEVRIAYVLNENRIKKAVNIIEKGLIEYNK